MPLHFWRFPDLTVYMDLLLTETIMTVKLTCHPQKGLYVVNTPGSHLQRRPRVYRSESRAMNRVAELLRAFHGTRPCSNSKSMH